MGGGGLYLSRTMLTARERAWFHRLLAKTASCFGKFYFEWRNGKRDECERGGDGGMVVIVVVVAGWGGGHDMEYSL